MRSFLYRTFYLSFMLQWKRLMTIFVFDKKNFYREIKYPHTIALLFFFYKKISIMICDTWYMIF